MQTDGYEYDYYGEARQDLPGDKTHTFLQLAKPLAYCYKRDTVTIYGNVVKATHGETRNEMLGSGDGSKALAILRAEAAAADLRRRADAGGRGQHAARSTSTTCEWHETDTLAGLGADRSHASSPAPTTTARRR